jgi:hyperosmotically inducible protein
VATADATKQRGGKKMKTLQSPGRGSSGAVVAVLVSLVICGALSYYFYTRSPSLQNAFHTVKESSQDASTTSKVRTALLVSKHVSAFDIKVETKQGEVTLAGQVPSEEIKAMAGAIAQDTSGVKQVHNSLAVNPSAERNPEMARLGDRVADLEIKTIVSDAFLKNPELKSQAIEAQVNNRVVTLTGTVETTTQKYAAQQIALQVSGVQELINNLNVSSPQTTPTSTDEKLAHRVEFELYSTKAISLKNVQVHSENGAVTLSGTVASRAEKLLAEKTAQTVEGVRRVVNNLATPDAIEPASL